jgi:hypothetical protein
VALVSFGKNPSRPMPSPPSYTPESDLQQHP